MTGGHQDELLLDAALRAFGQYGYAKTTMQDIARAAGISRATLYTRFATKEELSRAGARKVLARAVEQARSSLAATAGLGIIERADAAMAAYIGALLAQLPDGPHGGELIDASRPVVADITAESDAQLAVMLAAELEAAAAAGEIDLSRVYDGSAKAVADFLLAAAGALRHGTVNDDQWRSRRAMLFSVVRAALEPRK